MWLRSMLSVVFLCSLLGTTQISAQQSASAREYTLDIPAQSLEDALNAFSRQTHLRVEMYSDLVHGLVSNGLSGKFTPDAALQALLKNTGLRFKFLDADSVAIMSSKAPDKVTSSNATASTKLASATGVHSSADVLSVDGSGAENSSMQTVDQARESKSDTGGLDQIVVTGTHIRGVTSIGAPSISITRTDIDESGYATIQDLVSTLPQNFAGITPSSNLASGVNSFAQQNQNYATAIDLRGLGPQSTLTLLDGNRVAGNVDGRVVDVSLIPLSIVERIDVVTGGASAIYGADAVGGVANIILRHSYDGADTQVYYGGAKPGADRLEFDQLFGKEFERGGFVLAYEFGRDQPFSIERTDLLAPVSSAVSTTAGISVVTQDITPKDSQNALFVTGHFAVSSGVELTGEAMFVHRKLNDSSENGEPTVYEAYGSSAQTTSMYGVMGGAKIDLYGSWKLTLSSAASILQNSVAGNLDFDFTSGPPYISATTLDTRSAIRSLSAVADGNIATIAGVDVKSAVGAEVRQESIDESGTATTFLQAFYDRKVYAAFAELNIPFVDHGERAGIRHLELSLAARDDYYSDFGNAFDPQSSLIWQPIEGLNVLAAYAKAFRAPDLYSLNAPVHSDILPTTIATSANPAGVTVPGLTVSGGNPNLTPERATTWSGGLDYHLPWTPTTHVALSYYHINYSDRIETPFPNSSFINAALYPNSILNLHPTNAQAAQLLGLGTFEGNYSGAPWDQNPQTLVSQIPNLAILDDRFVNASLETLRGVDLNANSTIDSRIGKISLGINATDTLSHKFQVNSAFPAGSVINQVGLPVNIRFRVNAGLEYGPYSGFVFVNYTNHYENQFTTPVSTIASWTTVDLTLRFDTSKLVNDGPLRNITLTARAQNLLDRAPPPFYQGNYGILYDLVNANGMGRYLSLRLEKRW